MKEKVYEVRKIVGSRADPENQQNITGLQRMICAEGAVKESTLESKICSATRSHGGDFNQQCHEYKVLQWSWMIRIEVYTGSSN